MEKCHIGFSIDPRRREQVSDGRETKRKRGDLKQADFFEKGAGPQNSEEESWLSQTWAEREKTEGLGDEGRFCFCNKIM